MELTFSKATGKKPEQPVDIYLVFLLLPENIYLSLGKIITFTFELLKVFLIHLPNKVNK